MSYRVRASSTAAYNNLLDKQVLCLPSMTTLNKITAWTGLDNSAYLQLRVKKLSDLARNVTLIIDEIYIAMRVEYSGGQVHGLTPSGEV